MSYDARSYYAYLVETLARIYDVMNDCIIRLVLKEKQKQGWLNSTVGSYKSW